MRITKLSIRNFRTLEDISFEFPRYYSAICGKNDSGKTNIIRAIRGLMNEHDPFGYIDDEEISLKSDFTKWKDIEVDKREIGISMGLMANKDSDAGLYEFLTTHLSLKDDADDLEFCIDLRILSGESSGVVTVKVGSKIYDDLKAQEVLKKLQSSKIILFHNSTEPDPRLRYGRAFRDISEEHSEEIEKLNKTMSRGLKKIAKGHQEKMSELIGRLDQKYKLGLSLPDFNFTFLPFDITLGDSKVEVSLDNWGSGTKNRPLILLTLFKARQISEATKSAVKITPVIVIEEPESFLHPSAQAEFSRVLQDLAEELKVQVITTTHSPYMLSKDSPEANILLERKVAYKQNRGTEQVDTSGGHWMEPFGVALGLDTDEFVVWRDLFFAKSDHILLVEGDTDKGYLQLLQDETHGNNRLKFDGEIYPYGGIGNLKNGVLLSFLKNKYKQILITYDLDVESQIENVLKGQGYERGKGYMPIGLNDSGKKSIEGLVPESIKSAVYSANAALVEQSMSGTTDEKKSAKSQIKKYIFEKFKAEAVPGNEHYKSFYKLSKSINKAFSA